MLHELDGRRVVFVRGHGDLDTVTADSGQKLRDAVERAGGIGAVFIVIGQEQVPDAQDLILTAGIFRQGAFKELVDAVADVGGYLLLAVDGVTAGGKGLVGGRGDVVSGTVYSSVPSRSRITSFFFILSSKHCKFIEKCLYLPIN